MSMKMSVNVCIVMHVEMCVAVGTFVGLCTMVGVGTRHGRTYICFNMTTYADICIDRCLHDGHHVHLDVFKFQFFMNVGMYCESNGDREYMRADKHTINLR